MSKETVTIMWVWDGAQMLPLQRYGRLADKHFVVGENYRMEVQEDHSFVSHKHQFAWLHEAWLSLPEDVAGRFLNEDQLRKHALINGGFCDCASVVCASKAEAERWYKHITERDPYCIVKIEGNTFLHFTAHSQAMRSMGKERFQRSKDAVLNYVANLLEVHPQELAGIAA